MSWPPAVSAATKPVYASDRALLFQGDCLELMKSLPPGTVALTVTSPPYNIGKEYERPLPLEDYVQWSQEWIAAVHRLTAPAGSLWLNLGYVRVEGRGTAVPLPYFLWDKTPFYLMQEIIWNYGAGVAAKKMLSPRNEKVLWYVKDPQSYVFNLDDIRDPDVKYPNQKKNGKLKVNPLGKNPSDVWQIPKVTSGAGRASQERTPHPAQFPEALVERIILAGSNIGDVVLDPFIGSGTTAAVALRLGRRVIGLELREDYCQIASKRLQTVEQQLRVEREQQRLMA